jgi:heat shock protein HslJ
MRWVLSVVALVAAVASCSGLSTPGVTATDVDGRTYVAVGERPLVVGFHGGGMFIDAGCNTISGPYGVVDGQIRLTDPSGTFSTLGACFGSRQMARERWVRRLFDEGLAARFDGDELVLTTEDVELRLREEPA